MYIDSLYVCVGEEGGGALGLLYLTGLTFSFSKLTFVNSKITSPTFLEALYRADI